MVFGRHPYRRCGEVNLECKKIKTRKDLRGDVLAQRKLGFIENLFYIPQQSRQNLDGIHDCWTF